MIAGRSTAPVIALLATLLFAPAAEAHHFKGLPHFSYFENYPQVPQEEFLGQAGDYEYSLVLYDFQGLKKEDAYQPDDARLYLIIFNLRENRVYNGPIAVEILDRGAPIDSLEIEAPQEESVYSLQRTLPSTGRYSLAVTHLEGPPTRAVIPFRLSSQKTLWGKWVIGILALFVAVVAFGSRRARLAIDRRDALNRRKTR